MRRIKRWRYYCDFCKKSSGTRPSMERHEKGCTANPSRECGLCALSGTGAPLSKLILLIESRCAGVADDKLGGSCVDGVLAELENMAEHCPACTLAAIRQASVRIYPNFNFKTKLASWWIEHNAVEAENRGYY